METLQQFAGWLIFLVPTVYLLAFATELRHFLMRRRKSGKLPVVLMVLGAALHLAMLVMLGVIHGHMPLMSVWEAWSVIAFCLVVINLYLQYRTGVASVSVFIIGAVLLFQTVSSVKLVAAPVSNPVLVSPWFAVHASSTIGGYAAFAVSGLLSALYLLQRRQIRARKLGFIHSRLPSLGVLDKIGFHAAFAGLVLLSIGIFAGANFAYRVWGAYWSWDPKQVSALAVWLVYFANVILRLAARWRGTRTAVLSLVGVITWIFTFSGVHLLFQSMHEFY